LSDWEKTLSPQEKHQIAGTKLQISSNEQIQNPKQNHFGHCGLKIEIYLGFGIYDPKFCLVPDRPV
jgi:hypothetical protein